MNDFRFRRKFLAYDRETWEFEGHVFDISGKFLDIASIKPPLSGNILENLAGRSFDHLNLKIDILSRRGFFRRCMNKNVYNKMNERKGYKNATKE